MKTRVTEIGVATTAHLLLIRRRFDVQSTYRRNVPGSTGYNLYATGPRGASIEVNNAGRITLNKIE